ncbi:MAG: C39 family peptidase [Chlamydiia bacterium]|nr:C39 family peptidase [Chlamydiia bacterium]
MLVEYYPTHPFDECILSWNSMRPEEQWRFWLSLHTPAGWSDWLLYAEWGATGQRTFQSDSPTAYTFQDTAHPKQGLADGLRVRVEGKNLSTDLKMIPCLSQLSQFGLQMPSSPLSLVTLPGFGRSQIALPHPHAHRLCSPTSVVNAIERLTKQKLDPLLFAQKVHDSGFDIYGNWVLNTAEAYCALGGAYRCYVTRLAHFEALHRYLLKRLPVVVSVKGELPGALLPYSEGHLLCVTGYCPEKGVLCIDPAYKTDEATQAHYPLRPFLEAWGQRKNLAYVFELDNIPKIGI